MSVPFYLRPFRSRVMVYPHHRGLLMREGKLAAVLEPGSYFIRKKSEAIFLVSATSTSLSVTQDYATSDSGAVRIALSLQVRTTDPQAYYLAGGSFSDPRDRFGLAGFHGVDQVHQSLTLAVRATLTELVAGMTLEEAIQARPEALRTVEETVVAKGRSLGVQVEEVACSLYEPAGMSKSVLSDLLRADLEGQAAMKRARNEASVMRSLLNTARLVRENMGLLELRILTSGQKPRVAFTVSSPKESAPASSEEPREEQ